MWVFPKTQYSRVKDYEYKLTIVNPDAQSGTTGWTLREGGGAIKLRSSSDPAARIQAPYFQMGSYDPSSYYQDIDLVAQIPEVNSVADLDALEGSFEYLAWQSNYATNDPGMLQLQFLDSGSAVIGTHIGCFKMLNRYWRKTKLERPIPAGTQYARLIMYGDRTSGSETNANFDDLEARFKTKSLRAIPCGEGRAWAGNSDNILTITKPSGIQEGDLMVIHVVSRNKYITNYELMGNQGWNQVIGADMGSNWLTVPWTQSANEQSAVWWKVAGPSEPATWDVNLYDNGTDYAVGTFMAVRGIANPKVLDKSYGRSTYAPSVAMKKGGAVFAFYGNANGNSYVGNYTETYDFQGHVNIFSYGNACAFGAILTDTIDGDTGDVTASGASTAYCCHGMVSFWDAPVDTTEGLLLHFEGEEGETTFESSTSFQPAITSSGTINLTTADSKFGNSCLQIGTNGYLKIPTSHDIEIGTSDFVMDFWFKMITGGSRYFIISKGAYGDIYQPYFDMDTGVILMRNYVNRVHQVPTSPGVDTGFAKDVWNHFELSKTSNKFYYYFNGTLATMTDHSGVLNGITRLTDLRIGLDAGSAYSNGHRLDEFRFKKGTFGHTAATFTLPTVPYT